MKNWGLYVHIPFCPQLCPYCNFAVIVGREKLHARYAEAVCAELEQWRHLSVRGGLDTVFFGGGTPSLMAPELLGQILDSARDCLGVKGEAEISLEANPGTADAECFAALRQCGFNRLSLGVQSFADEGLQLLGRQHTAAQAARACQAARQAGFENLSLDLIFAIPGALPAQWRHSLERAIELQPEHLSAYALTIEQDTRFGRWQRQGRLAPLAEEEEARQYEWAVARLEEAGYEHYEVSNFARPGRRSRHNWGYWTGGEYLGVGLAAHSLVGRRRSWNQRKLKHYLEAVEAGRSPGAGSEDLDAATTRREQLWLGLRTCEGIAAPSFLARQRRFQDLVAAGHLRVCGGRVGLTRQGFALADALSVELMELAEREQV